MTFGDPLQRQRVEFKASPIMKELQNRYGRAADASTIAFLASHRAIPGLLVEAFERLQESFGNDIVVNLEVSTDDEGYQVLYVVTLWKENAAQAAAAFDSFVERWWIHRMREATSDIAFVYQLV